MSGGHFYYRQYATEEIASEIDEIIRNNGDTSFDEYGSCKGYGLSPEVLERFKEASHNLKQAAEMAQRVDWLLSGDDGEESFLTRWNEEVRPYYNEKDQ